MNKKRLAPLLIIVVGIGLSLVLLATGPNMVPRPPKTLAPLVRIVPVALESVPLSVTTHGTVAPRTESDVVPEVSGRVVAISPALVSGGFFARDEVLLTIDPVDYEVALEQARAGLARAQSDLTITRKNHSRQLDLSKTQATSESQRDETLNRLLIATAGLKEAKAKLSKAELDLERTRILAPYDGRVRSEKVDIGQFVNRGAPIATIYAVDFAEVRLPIHDEELAYLNVSLGQNGAGEALSIPVVLSARFGGEEQQWQAEVVRTEGELDPRTRMVNVVARVAAPYAHNPPLSVGLFVDAVITGRVVDGLVVLPRSALRGSDQVLLVDDANQLRFRTVDVLRLTNEQAYVRAGLATAERVAVSPLEAPVEGMTVRPVASEQQTAARSEDG